MFKKSLTTAIAALTLVSASLTTAPAQAGSFGKFVAAGIVGAVVGSALASRARSAPAYGPGHQVDEDCGFVNRPVFDEFGRKIGFRRVPEC